MSTQISNRFRVIVSILIVAIAAIAAMANGTLEPAVQNKSQIAEAEQLLTDLGYLIENTDGRLDFMSRHAVMAFQKVEIARDTGQSVLAER